MRIIGKVLVLLFGLLFAGAGGYILSETAVPTYQSWQTMQDWQSATATLISVQSANNDTRARYSYYWDGFQYHNNRVYVANFKDNIGSYHKDLSDKLKRHLRMNEPVKIWVNAGNPEESVIDREMRWGLFALMTGFCSVFVLVGLGVCYAGLCVTRSGLAADLSTSELKQEWQKKQSDPNYKESFIDYRRYRLHELRKCGDQEESVQGNSAWLKKKEWHTNRIRSQAKSGVMTMWFITFFWNALSWPVVFAVPEEWAKGNYAILIGLLFPLVGIFLLFKAIQLTLEYRRFGIIEFIMDPFPGAIGGHVGGTLEIKNIFDLNAVYKVELECVYSYVSGSGKNRSRRERIKWAEIGKANVESVSNGVHLLFRFNVPDDLPEADIKQRNDYYFWRLKVKADLPGVDLDRSYNIPVFATGEKSRHVKHDLSAQMREFRQQEASKSQAAIQRGDFKATALSRSMIFTDRRDGLRMYFPMFRDKVLTIFALIFAVGFDFATYSIIDNFADDGLWSILAFVFATPFALVGLFASLAVIYLPFNNLTVTIKRGNIKVLRRLFILPLVMKNISGSDVTGLEIKRSGSTGEGTAKITHFRIIAKYGRGRSATIAEDIDGEDLAIQFKDYLYNRVKAGY